MPLSVAEPFHFEIDRTKRVVRIVEIGIFGNELLQPHASAVGIALKPVFARAFKFGDSLLGKRALQFRHINSLINLTCEVENDRSYDFVVEL